MNFDEELKAILEHVEGAHCAMLMGADGISVSEMKNPACETLVTEVVIECSRLLQDASKIMQGNNWGALHEMVLSTDRHRLILRMLGDQYFLALFLDASADLGKGRYWLRKTAPRLAQEL